MDIKEFVPTLEALIEGKQIQGYREPISEHSEWVDLPTEVILARIRNGCPLSMFRIKPDTITVNGTEINAPMREIPKDGSKYWVPHLSSKNYAFSSLWDDSDMDHIWLKRGLCFRTEADAKAAAEAMIKALGGEA